jgi:Transposase DDE domain
MPRWYGEQALPRGSQRRPWRHGMHGDWRTGRSAYSAIAIETSLALRLVFHQPLRQTEGLLRSIADVLGINIAIPDHTTLSRRGGDGASCTSG